MPVTKDANPRNVLKGVALVISPPIIQSWAHISTTPTHTNIPAEKALNVPMAMMVAGSLPLKWLSMPVPNAIPAGVMKAKIDPRKSFLRRHTVDVYLHAVSGAQGDSA